MAKVVHQATIFLVFRVGEDHFLHPSVDELVLESLRHLDFPPQLQLDDHDFSVPLLFPDLPQHVVEGRVFLPHHPLKTVVPTCAERNASIPSANNTHQH